MRGFAIETEKAPDRDGGFFAARTTRSVHLVMMAGNHFPPKNGYRAHKECAKGGGFLGNGVIFAFLCDVLRTYC